MRKIIAIAVSLFMSIAVFGQFDDYAVQSPAASFVVNSTADTSDVNLNDNLCLDASGNCTLRAAIQQANYTDGSDTISFALNTPATINVSSELPVSQSVTISGPGARSLFVQRDSSVTFSRIFSILGPFGITTVNINGLTIANGRMGTGFGGGIQSNPGNTLNLSAVSIKNNTAELGAGILNYGTLNIVSSTISGNVANSEGGGIHNQSIGILNVANTTISGNSATNFGGGIITFNQTTLNNVTITRNSTSRYGGGVYGSAAIFVRNTIIANNGATYGGYDVYNTFTSLGNNLIGKNDQSNFPASSPAGAAQANGDKVGTSTAPLNAMVESTLKDNGGQTDTHQLLAGSPAIDGGNNCVVSAICSSNSPASLSFDQRSAGFSRQNDGNNDGTPIVDMGAFEYLGSAFGPTAANATIQGRFLTVNARGVSKVRVTLTSLNGEIRSELTNPFGYYRFDSIDSGATYIINAEHKQYRFESKVISVNESLSGVDFIASDILNKENQ